MPDKPPRTEIKHQLQAIADTCVMCGMCSTSCPSYQVQRIEQESPRGRISLINAWAQDNLAESQTLTRHIESCLSCGQCENVCPSGVQYSKLIALFKQAYDWEHKIPGNTRRIIRLLRDTRKNLLLFQASKIVQRSGLAWLGEISGLTQRLGLGHLQRLAKQTSSYTKTDLKTSTKSGIAIFTGCIGRHAESDTIHAAQTLLTNLGQQVHIPQEQGCCGALAANLGDAQGMEQDAQRNITIFGQKHITQIGFIASGCGSALKRLQTQLPNTPITDLTQIVSAILETRPTRFRPLAKRVLLHKPCTQRHALKNEGDSMSILGRIPELEIRVLKTRSSCCGAGGSHLLDPQENNQVLRNRIIEDISAEHPDIIVTSNIGCRLQIKLGLEEAGLDIPVVHPLLLLQQQLIEETHESSNEPH
ncbi:MAG: (Fe-S)-binding protein [Gammaproteobacteria bacterium]|nr:(Fe-S)-binding protein [Gammaproteobacteria bacterium]